MEKRAYRVRDDVERINGKTVPADRMVYLTETEALFDRALGRLVPAQLKRPRRRRKREDGGS